MNKTGSLFSMTTVFILLALTIGAAITAGNIPAETVLNSFEVALENSTSEFNFTTPDYPEIGNALSYYTTGLMKAYKEIAVWVVKFVIVNPTAPYKLLFYGLILAIFAPLIIVLFKLLIIIFLLSKELVQRRKEKRKLKEFMEDEYGED